MKPFFFTLTYALLITASSHGMAYEPAENERTIHGAGDIKISMDHWNKRISGWTTIKYQNGEKNFPLYETTAAGQDTPNTFVSTSTSELSPDKKLILLNRIVIGEVVDFDETNSKLTENTYCDVIDMTTGCIMDSGPNTYCAGKWEQDKWENMYSPTGIPTLQTINPSKLLSTVKKITKKKEAIQTSLYMGVESYLACYPAKNNIQNLNDLAFYLAEEGDNFNAMKLYREIEKVSPSRTVLKLNIADTLWADGKFNESKKYYAEYKTLMEEAGRSKRMPAHVAARLNNP